MAAQRPTPNGWLQEHLRFIIAQNADLKASLQKQLDAAQADRADLRRGIDANRAEIAGLKKRASAWGALSGAATALVAFVSSRLLP